jgi:hypothetical protein
MEIPLASAMTSASAVMKVFMAGLRRRLTVTVAALAEIQREAIHTPSNEDCAEYCPSKVRRVAPRCEAPPEVAVSVGTYLL